MHALAPQPAYTRRSPAACGGHRAAFWAARAASPGFNRSSKPRSVRQPLPHARASTTEQATATEGQQLLGGNKEDALLLAWFASKNRSLLATQCFVETVLECYQHGTIVDELEMALQLRNLQSEARVLQPLEQDVVMTWMLLIMLTLRTLGVPFTPSTASADAAATDQERSASNAQASTSSSGTSSVSSSPGAAPSDTNSKDSFGIDITRKHTKEVTGLLQYVRTNLANYDSKQFSLQSVQALHYAINSVPDANSPKTSMFQELMQQYTVLILCTFEVAASLKLPMDTQVTQPLSVKAPLGYVAAFTGQRAQQQGPPDATEVRAAAVRLLVAFMGAVLDSPYSAQRFALYASQAYDAGISAAQLYESLQPAEFEQLGMLLPSAGPIRQEKEDINFNSQLFAQQLSIAYMVFAQMGVAFPAAEVDGSLQDGWAWAGAGDEVQANAMAAFVAGALRRETSKAKSWLDQAPEDPLATKIKSIPEAAQALEAEQRAAAEEIRTQGTLHGKELPTLVKMPDQKLGSTSPAVLVWRQHLQVVEAAKKLVLTVLQQEGAANDDVRP